MDESTILDSRPPHAEMADMTVDSFGGSVRLQKVATKGRIQAMAAEEDELEVLEAFTGENHPKTNNALDESTFGFSALTTEMPMIADENGSFLINNTLNMSMMPIQPSKKVSTKNSPNKTGKFDTTSMSALMNNWREDEVNAPNLLDESMFCAEEILPPSLRKSPMKAAITRPTIIQKPVSQAKDEVCKQNPADNDVFKLPSIPASRMAAVKKSSRSGLMADDKTHSDSPRPTSKSPANIFAQMSAQNPSRARMIDKTSPKKTAASEIASSESRIRAMLASRSPTKSITTPSRLVAPTYRSSALKGPATPSDGMLPPTLQRPAVTGLPSPRPTKPANTTTSTSQSRSAIRSQTYQNFASLLTEPALSSPSRNSPGGIVRSRTLGSLAGEAAQPAKSRLAPSTSLFGINKQTEKPSSLPSSRSIPALSSITNSSDIATPLKTRTFVTKPVSVRFKPPIAGTSARGGMTTPSKTSFTSAATPFTGQVEKVERRRSLIATPSRRPTSVSVAHSSGATQTPLDDIPRRRRF